MRFKIRQENEERQQHAPLPRRGGVSSPPHRVAGIGLDEASMPAPPLSLPMNAAETARTSQLRREGNDLRAPTRNRHNDRTTTPQPATFATGDTGNASGSWVASRDQLPQVEDLAAARFRRQIENSIRLRGTEDPFDCLSWLDQSAVAETTESSEQAQTTNTHRPPLALVVHTQPRSRGLAQRGHGPQRSLRRIADVVRLGWSCLRCRPTLSIRANAGSGDGIPPVRLLEDVADGSVVPPGVSRVRVTTGPMRVW